MVYEGKMVDHHSVKMEIAGSLPVVHPRTRSLIGKAPS